ncbi:hypothetical protein FQA39_LY09404 [Lamprigera yunnana]|nr:hypothetical protein FQA39_LY09404 [Lamprigera yunnana]
MGVQQQLKTVDYEEKLLLYICLVVDGLLSQEVCDIALAENEIVENPLLESSFTTAVLSTTNIPLSSSH